MRTPELLSPARPRHFPKIATLFVAATLLMLIVAPVPWRLLAVCAVVGALGGLALVPRVFVLTAAALFGLIVGVSRLGAWIAPGLASLWWEPYFITAAAMIATYYGVLAAAKLRWR